MADGDVVELTGESRIVLRPLSVTVRRPGELLVGDLSQGEFVVLPEIAGAVIDAIREHRTLAQAEAALLATLGEEIDVVDFAGSLLDLDFVASVNAVELGASDRRTLYTGGRIAAAVLQVLRPFFSLPAFVCYALLFVTDVVLLLGAVPSLRLHSSELFFLHDPMLSLAAVGATLLVSGACHELAHWFGARNEDVPSRIEVSRRGFIMVMQTDLSLLRTVPRRRRFAALMAGPAWDTVVLSALVLPRAAAAAGWWHPPVVFAGYLAAVTVGLATAMTFQLMVFARTDLYAVLAFGYDCLNLTRVSRLMLRAWFRPLNAELRAELDNADPNDLRVARWYRVLLGVGIVAGTGYLFDIAIPAAWRIIRWVWAGLAHHSPAGFAFWEALVSGVVLLLPDVVIPLVLAVRDHAPRWRAWARQRRNEDAVLEAAETASG